MLAKLLLGLPVLLVGAAVALQSLVNAGLSQRLGSPVVASAVSFWVGTTVLTVAALASGGVGQAIANAKTVGFGWWVGGGLLGALFVTTITLMVPKLGVAVTIAFVIAGQLLTAALLDHFGVLGIAEQPLTWSRIAGVVLLLAGALMVRFS